MIKNSVYGIYFARCMKIFNSLLAQLVKYDVHTTRKINSIHAIFYHILSLYNFRAYSLRLLTGRHKARACLYHLSISFVHVARTRSLPRFEYTDTVCNCSDSLTSDKNTRNSSGDETAYVNFLYVDIVHVYYKALRDCALPKLHNTA